MENWHSAGPGLSLMNIYSVYSNQYGRPVLKLSVDYVTSTTDYVDDSDKGKLRSMEVIARTNAEHVSFFKEIEKLMRSQCDCPAGSDDLHIHLSPVFKVTVYKSEEDFTENSPRTYRFVQFFPKFYERVGKLRST